MYNKSRKDKLMTKRVMWWNLPIDELEEMADENGKIKKPKEESEQENNDYKKDNS